MSAHPAGTRGAAVLAAHRYGLAEASLDAIGNDARGWLQAQIGPADAQIGNGLADAATGLRRHVAYQQMRRQRSGLAADTQDMRSAEQQFGEHFRTLVQADLRARLVTAASTRRPFAERLALFWANHFTVSMAKASVRGMVGAFEREAIRPHIASRFETLLAAAVKHPAMLRYLDNDQSAGPQSRLVQRLARQPRAEAAIGPRLTGLNENLAREVLELHTLGVGGGYTQSDVTEFARVLTGWRVPLRDFQTDPPVAGAAVSLFEPAWHDPGPKQVLGRRYAEGPLALDELLHELTLHPSTARFVATKLARHFVADEPPQALVARLAETFQRSGGDLPQVYAALLQAPEAWTPQPAKLKTPEEFVVSTARLLGLGRL